MTRKVPQILLVGDDPDAVDTFIPALKEAGYEVERVEGSTQAVEALKRRRPDLVVVDLADPDGRCFDVARELASTNPCRGIPVVVITAVTPLDAIDSHKNELSVVRRCIFKPCRPRTFLEAIDDVLPRP